MLEMLLLVITAEQCIPIDGKLTYIQINEEIRNAVNLIPGTEWAPYPHHLRSRSLPPGTLGTSGHTIVLSLNYDTNI